MSADQIQRVQAAVHEQRDIFVSMSPGTVTAFIDQFPSVLGDLKLTVVFSPLLSQIEDQVVSLKERDIFAEKITSDVELTERDSIFQGFEVDEGNTPKFLYVTPEMAGTFTFKNKLMKFINQVSYFIVEEASFGTEFGRYFRPDFLSLNDNREENPMVPWIVLTSATSPEVIEEITHQLSLNSIEEIKLSCVRQNVYYEVLFPTLWQKDDYNYLHNYCIQSLGASWQDKKLSKRTHGIIFCRTKDMTRQIAGVLTAKGLPTEFYYGSLENDERTELVDRWRKGYIPVVAATSSFNVGVCHGSIRFVAHLTVPKSAESYARDCSNVGRNGENSRCCIFVTGDEENCVRYLLRMDVGNRLKEPSALELFEKVVEYWKNPTCRHRFFAGYFQGQDVENCGQNCDVCKNTTQTVGSSLLYLHNSMQCAQNCNYCIIHGRHIPVLTPPTI